MDSTHYHEFYYPDYTYPGFPVSYTDHHPPDQYPCGPTTPPGPTVASHTQYPTIWDTTQVPPPLISPTNPTSPYSSEADYPVIGAQPVGAYQSQPQSTSFLHAERVIRPDAESGSKGEGGPQDHKEPQTTRELVPQETFRPARQQRVPGSSRVIEFSVYGGKGVRLFDALDGNWGDFEGRDDRSLFGNDRSQITIRLHFAGCPSWHSKIPTTDHTARHRPITRMKLAYQVAKAVRKFIARERADGHKEDHPPCGWKDMSLKNVYLTRLVHVSTASWQPEIFVERPSAVTFPASSPSSS